MTIVCFSIEIHWVEARCEIKQKINLFLKIFNLKSPTLKLRTNSFLGIKSDLLSWMKVQHCNFPTTKRPGHVGMLGLYTIWMVNDFQLKVRQFQKEFMKLSFLPKYEQKIVRISALCSEDRNLDNFFVRILGETMTLSDLYSAVSHWSIIGTLSRGVDIESSQCPQKGVSLNEHFIHIWKHSNFDLHIKICAKAHDRFRVLKTTFDQKKSFSWMTGNSKFYLWFTFTKSKDKRHQEGLKIAVFFWVYFQF